MIELLLKAENALALGMLDQAERVFWQVIEHDPKNAIAVVGLSRVALERGDEWTAMDFASRALAIDADNATAKRLLTRLAEVIGRRGDGPRGKPTAPLFAAVSAVPAGEPEAAPAVEPEAAPAVETVTPSGEPSATADEPAVAPAREDAAPAAAPAAATAPAPASAPARPNGLAPLNRPPGASPAAPIRKKRGLLARLFGRS